MAIKNKLTKDKNANSYGIDFNEAYFKIEDAIPNFSRGIVTIQVRGYASKEARDKQKEIEVNRKKYSKLSMGDDDFDEAFEQSSYDDVEEYRAYIEEQQEKYMHNIIGIYKESFEINIDDLKMKSFTKDGIITACYEYIKTLDEFKSGESC